MMYVLNCESIENTHMCLNALTNITCYWSNNVCRGVDLCHMNSNEIKSFINETIKWGRSPCGTNHSGAYVGILLFIVIVLIKLYAIIKK